jgi:hypothetical protein
LSSTRSYCSFCCQAKLDSLQGDVNEIKASLLEIEQLLRLKS